MKSSISRVKLFKACRRAYYFRYKQDLVPVKDADTLVTGKLYHEYIEGLYNGEMPDGLTKECAMALAYDKYIRPQVNIVESEKWLEKTIGKHTLVGKVDGIDENGNLVEHKTTSSDISDGGEYEFNLQWDEQILAYMSLTGQRVVHYTVCRKPTIRLKKDESEEDFFKRMCEWYDTDTDHKIRTFDIYRTDQEVAQFEQEFEQICDEMERAEKLDTLYKCQNYCNNWGRRCEYSSICLTYDPDQKYIEFDRREKQYEN